MTDRSSSFDLYPAIDLRGGRAVRLLRGDFDAETVYARDPVAQAEVFASAGARWIHVVDLDAARTGDPANREVIASICAAVDVAIQAGGGVRDRAAARELVDVGVRRVVLGTAAVEQPDLVERLCAELPGQVAVGLDARGRAVATRGWTSETREDLVDLARRFARVGVAALVVTEIERDGTMDGPDLEQLASVVGAVDVPVVASGGVGSLDDLRALAALSVKGSTLAGAIAGRALYESRFSLAEGIAACSRPE